MRRVLLVALVVTVVGGVLWALWPATTWPRAFCDPVVKVVGADVVPLSISFSHPEPVLSAAQQKMVAVLRNDVRRAAINAPTSTLRTELNNYLSQLESRPTMLKVSDAFSQFDQHARTQLRACGVTPTGH